MQGKVKAPSGRGKDLVVVHTKSEKKDEHRELIGLIKSSLNSFMSHKERINEQLSYLFDLMSQQSISSLIKTLTSISGVDTNIKNIVSMEVNKFVRVLEEIDEATQITIFKENHELIEHMVKPFVFIVEKINQLPDSITTIIIQKIQHVKQSGIDKESEEKFAVEKIMKRIGRIVQNSFHYMRCIGGLFKYIISDNSTYYTLSKSILKHKIIYWLCSALFLGEKMKTLNQELEEEESIDPDVFKKLYRNLVHLVYVAISLEESFLIENFVVNDGIKLIHEILNISFQMDYYETYCYALGIIPIITLTEFVNYKKISDNKISLLMNLHLTELSHTTSPSKKCLLGPLALAMRSLLYSYGPIYFAHIREIINILFEISQGSHQNQEYECVFFSINAFIGEILYFANSQKLQISMGNLSTGEWKNISQKLWRGYIAIREQISTIRGRHFDDKIVHKALISLANCFQKSADCRLFFRMIQGNMRILINCLLNLDENVMLQGLMTTYCLLEHDEMAQEIFVKKRGIEALADCLYDYNIQIRIESLSILSLLLSSRNQDKNTLRNLGILKHLVQIITNYPAEDIPLSVLDGSLIVLSHAITRNKQNQKHILQLQTLDILARLFKIILGNTEKNLALSAFDNICHCFSNLCFGNKHCQKLLMTNNILATALGYLENRVNYALEDEHIAHLLNILVNATDTNIHVQEYLSNNNLPFGEKDIGMRGSLLDLVKNLLEDSNPKLLATTALWVSHIVFNFKTGQKLIGTEKTITRFLHLAEYSSMRHFYNAEVAMEISFYALLALINLSHQYTPTQEIIGSQSGVEMLLSLLSISEYGPKKTACFCLSNLVKKNSINAERVVSQNGLKLLIDLINDEEDDELSKKAYGTIEDLEEYAIEGLYPILKSSISSLALSPYINISPEQQEFTYLSKKPIEKQEKPFLRVNQAIFSGNLEKVLPVLNGLIYINNKSKDFLVEKFGLNELCEVLNRSVSIDIGGYSLYIISNITIEKNLALQRTAVKSGCLQSVSHYALELSRCLDIVNKILDDKMFAVYSECMTEGKIVTNLYYGKEELARSEKESLKIDWNGLKVTMIELKMLAYDILYNITLNNLEYALILVNIMGITKLITDYAQDILSSQDNLKTQVANLFLSLVDLEETRKVR